MASPNTPHLPQLTRPSFLRSISSSSSNQGSQASKPLRKDKPRLYLGIYPRGGSNLTSPYSSSMTCDSYHWVLLVGPQSPSRSAPGRCYQIVHASPSSALNTAAIPSFYEESDLSQQSQAQSQALLARITIAKVMDEDRLRSLLLTLPPSTSAGSATHCNRSDSGYDTDDAHATSTCLAWVRAAYKLLLNDPKCLRCYVSPEDWADLEDVVRMYVRVKRRHGRFGGQRNGVVTTWSENEIPTWNFWENRETTP